MSETVRDVCDEMRKELNQSWWDVDREKVHDIPDRIIAAHEREISEKDAEIARLKAALKPVMDYDFGDYDPPWKPLKVDGEAMNGCVRTSLGFPLSVIDDATFGIGAFIEMANAIGEAKSVMRKGEEE